MVIFETVFLAHDFNPGLITLIPPASVELFFPLLVCLQQNISSFSQAQMHKTPICSSAGLLNYKQYRPLHISVTDYESFCETLVCLGTKGNKHIFTYGAWDDDGSM